MLEQARFRARDAGVRLDLRQGDMRDLVLEEKTSTDLLPVPRAPAPAYLVRSATYPSSGSRGRFVPVDDSRGTPLPSTTRLPLSWTDSIRTNRSYTRIGMPPPTTGSTSFWMTAPPAPCGGQPRTNGSACWMSQGWSSRHSSGGFDGQPLTDESPEYVFVARLPTAGRRSP